MEIQNQLITQLVRLSLLGIAVISSSSCIKREPNPAILGEWVMPGKFPGIMEFDGLQLTIHPSVGCGMSHCDKLTKVVDYDLNTAGDRYVISFDDRQIVSGQEGWTGTIVEQESRPHTWDDLILRKQDDCTFIDLVDGDLMHSAEPSCPAVPLEPISIKNEDGPSKAIYLLSRYNNEGWSIYSRHYGREKLEIEGQGSDVLSNFKCGKIGVVAAEIPTQNGQPRRLIIHGISTDIRPESRPC